MRLLQEIWRLDLALQRITSELTPQCAVKKTPVDSCVGLLSAEDIFAPEPLPHFVRSTMDGFAVRAKATFGATEAIPSMLVLGGQGQDSCVPVLTGGALPTGYDAVVMLEYAETLADGTVLFTRPVAVGENIISIGEDVNKETLIIKRGEQFTVRNVSVLSALGITQVNTIDFRVAILSSGNEIVPPSSTPLVSQVRDSNSALLMALCRQMGFYPHFLGIIPDDEHLLIGALSEALNKYDAVIVSGGSSAGSVDYTARCMQQLGSPGVLVHGLSIKPGKPTILGVSNRKLMIGLPGHPLSCAVTAHIVAAPLLYLAAGAEVAQRLSLRLPLTKSIASVPGRRDYVPIKVLEYGAEPLTAKSAAVGVLAQSDGFIELSEECEGYRVGEIVSVQMWR